ncbi:hypothetical protein M0811_12139 [Anaeramoeba ignava]|uniref:Nuclear transport factor 2 n=1 Tax=Anaeramoeba ignava TaxID=1746090 RepID=A0A9Q0R708_ANAIG|nr:hypothetical protein M0811_12139 [Anaeramoeba ignava]
MGESFDTVAQQFVDNYYPAYDQDATQIGYFYRDNSMLTYEGRQAKGTDSILQEFASRKFKRLEHKVTSYAAQPSIQDGSVLILVSGQIAFDEGNTPPLFFSETFLLAQDGGYYIFNQIFSLNYG